MGVTVAVTRVACSTSTGTQDITTTDMGGLTPKAAILIVSYGITDGTAAADRVLSVGATDGTREYASVSTDEDNQGTTDCYSFGKTNSCVFIIIPGESTTDGSAEFSSWLTNGIQINWTDAPAAAYLMTVVLFGGSDLTTYVGIEDLGNTVDLVNDVTAPGFTPDVVVPMFVRIGGTTQVYSSFGVVHFDGDSTVTQRAFSFFSFNNQATSRVSGYARTDAGVMENLGDSSVDWWGEFGDFDANGFSITTRNNGANNWDAIYVALNFGGAVNSWVGTHTTPTATGNDSETGPGFTPQFVFMLGSLIEATNTFYTDNRGGSEAISVFTSTAEYTTVVCSEDAVGTSNTQSLSDDRAIVIPDDDGTLDIEATYVSMDANGWTVNYSNAPATAKLFFALAIEEETADLSISVSDSISISELIGFGHVEVADSLTVTDSASLLLRHQLNISDAVTLADVASVSVEGAADLSVSEAEAVAVAESVILTLIHLIDAGDAISVADTAALLLEHQVSVSDAVALAESIVLTLAHQVNVSDSLTVADVASLLLRHQVSAADGVSLADVAALLLEHQIDAADAITTADVVTLLLEHHISTADAIAVAESVVLALAHQIDTGDAIGVADTAALLLRYQIGASDAIAVSEAVTLALISYISASDAVVVADDPTVLLIEPDLGISVDATNSDHLIRGVKVTA